MTKSCRKCGNEKECSAFRSNPRCRDGLTRGAPSATTRQRGYGERNVARQSGRPLGFAGRPSPSGCDATRLSGAPALPRPRQSARRELRVSCVPFKFKSLLPSEGSRKKRLPDRDAPSPPGVERAGSDDLGISQLAALGCCSSRTRKAAMRSLTPRMMAKAATHATSRIALRP